MFNELELEIIEWYKRQTSNGSDWPKISDAQFVSRKFTGCGCCTEFKATSTDVTPPRPVKMPPQNGPNIKSPVLKNGAGTVLFYDSDGLCTLEIFTYDDAMIGALDDFTLE